MSEAERAQTLPRERRDAADRQRDDVRELMQRQAGRVEAERFARAAQAREPHKRCDNKSRSRKPLLRLNALPAQSEQGSCVSRMRFLCPATAFCRAGQSAYQTEWPDVYAGGNVVGATAPVALPGILGGVADFFGVQPKAYTGISDVGLTRLM